jgi:general stress protein 26
VHPVAEIDARFSAPGAVATPWEDTLRIIQAAELFWIATVRADGRPHVTPLPAVWDDDALHFCTGAREQKAVNLAHDPHCTLTTGTNVWNVGIDVVVEGVAKRVIDDARLHRLAGGWEAKYDGDWHFAVANGAFQGQGGEALVFEVVATKIIAFAKGDFAQTRYRF